MEKFQLAVLFKIIGIGSASGLVYHENKLYLISDNSTFLFEYSFISNKVTKIPLLDNAEENIRKKDKPDFESITLSNDNLILLGSGSKTNRNSIITYNLKTNNINIKSIGLVYSSIKSQHGIKDDTLNIEGLIQKDTQRFLFQRGNGQAKKNGIFCYNETHENPKIYFTPIDLPKIKNIPSTFTDSILVDQTIYFLASAESSKSTYEDGEILGSFIGTIDLKSMKLLQTIQISDKHKFEGLTLYKKTATQIVFLLCEDNDSELLVSEIYQLELKINN